MEDDEVEKLSPEAQADLVRQCANARTEETFVEHAHADLKRAAMELAADYEKILWNVPYVLYQSSPIVFKKIKTGAASKEVGRLLGINTKALGGFFDLAALEVTPTLEPARAEPIQEAEVVSSCPPPEPLKSDYDKRMERAADLLRSPGQDEVHLRQPVPGKRCYVCDHHERAVAPSRISGALLCVLCAVRLVED